MSAVDEVWKGNTLTAERLFFSEAGQFLESRGFARNIVFLFSLPSFGCKFLESSRVPGALVPSGNSSAFVSAHLFTGKGVSKQFSQWSYFFSLSRQRIERSHNFLSFEYAGLQRIARDAALVDVEQGVSLAPSPGSSSSTPKKKFPLEHDGRITILDDTGELASERGIGFLSTSSQSPLCAKSPPVRSPFVELVCF